MDESGPPDIPGTSETPGTPDPAGVPDLLGIEEAPAERGRVSRLAILLPSQAARAEGQPALIHWCTWAPPWQQFGHNDSYALVTPDGPVLVDPEWPAAAEAERLWSLAGGRPVASVLTCGSHERGCYALRRRFGTPVWAPAEATPQRCGAADGLQGQPDHTYEAGTSLPGGLRPIALHGAPGGAHALLWQAPGTGPGRQVVFVGDVLATGASPEHPHYLELWDHRPGIYLGPGPSYPPHCDLPRLRASLQHLLQQLQEHGCDLLCSGHGTPYRRPLPALSRLLELDWPARLRAGQPVASYASETP